MDATSVTVAPGDRAAPGSAPSRRTSDAQASGGAARTTRSAPRTASSGSAATASITPAASAARGPSPDGVQATSSAAGVPAPPAGRAPPTRRSARARGTRCASADYRGRGWSSHSAPSRCAPIGLDQPPASCSRRCAARRSANRRSPTPGGGPGSSAGSGGGRLPAIELRGVRGRGTAPQRGHRRSSANSDVDRRRRCRPGDRRRGRRASARADPAVRAVACPATAIAAQPTFGRSASASATFSAGYS